MTRLELNKEYFDWMCGLIGGARYLRRGSYHKLLKRLHEIEFYYILDMDGNRSADGTDLRYRFAYECDIHPSMVASYLDDKPCSVLEMLIALSLRCEEHIMSNTEAGDRTGKWFWNMIDNLGLKEMNDSRFDIFKVNSVIDRFLTREYSPTGEGGLVTIPNCQQDLRKVEIWYQLMWYFTYILSKGE